MILTTREGTETGERIEFRAFPLWSPSCPGEELKLVKRVRIEGWPSGKELKEGEGYWKLIVLTTRGVDPYLFEITKETIEAAPKQDTEYSMNTMNMLGVKHSVKEVK